MKLRKISLLFFIFAIVSFGFPQNLHVRYINVRSPIAKLYEDLYIKNNQVISVQDSLIVFDKNTGEGNINMIAKSDRKIKKEYNVSDVTNDNSRNFFFTAYIDTNDFFVFDNVPKPLWIIDEHTKKKVAGYKCIKAEAVFRGSKIEAYFTKDIPIDAGPFKFYGLPGLILDIRVVGKSYDIWKAEFVNFNDNTKIIYKPQFLNKEKISMKEFVNMKEEHLNKLFKKTASSFSSNYNIRVENKRLGIEKIYEWEEKQ